MRITAKRALGQLLLLLAIFTLSACKGKNEEAPVIPPITSPLSRDFIGFGVVTASFTHLTFDPVEDSPTKGYLRRGSLVRILKRQQVKTANGFSSWVLAEGSQQGWLREEVLEIYDNESRAKTASESLIKN